MSGWSKWGKRDLTFASPYVDWEMELLKQLGRQDQVGKIVTASSLANHDVKDNQRDTFLVPVHMINSNDGSGAETPSVHPNELDEKDVVVGVIDIDVAFGNRNFRTKEGDSRVLASWQQGAPGGGSTNPSLPFGRELKHADIQLLLEKHSAGADLKRPFDHESFYREAGLVQQSVHPGMGGLAKRAAHGTHVMGAAAGAHPNGGDKAFSERVKLLVVNLPPPAFFGEGGAFLDDYLAYGLRWIIEANSKLRRANETDKAPPLFINISFGKQAGGRDSTQKFVGELLKIAEEDPQNRRGPTIFLPAGNDNLERCHAKFKLGQLKKDQVVWRVQPDDGTSNLVEIWGEEWYTAADKKRLFSESAPFSLEVLLPGESAPARILPRPITQYQRRMRNGFGRVYFDWVPSSTQKKFRARYVVCLAPTGRMVGNAPPAPAGAYTICVKSWDKSQQISVNAHIQTDEVTSTSSRIARRSYFEDSTYLKFEKDGRRADTFFNVKIGIDRRARKNRKKSFEDDPDNYVDENNVVQRKGTLNSYAENHKVTVIGGFRASDGRPALYSSSGNGAIKPGRVRGAPTASLPSDDGYAHFGILSNGSKDGSTVAMRGTSFACATAVRLAVVRFLEATKTNQDSFKAWEEIKEFEDVELRSKWVDLRTVVTKVGEVRIPYQVERPVKRM